MKLTISPTDLRSAYAIARTAVATRATTRPILGHILFDAGVERLVLSGTDLESRAWHTVTAEVEEPGAVALPMAALSDFIESADETVQIAVGANHKAVLVSGRSELRLAGLDAEGFPPPTDTSDPSLDLTLGADLFAGLVARVGHAIAKSDSRAELAGIHLTGQDGTLQMEAADGFRCARASKPVEGMPDLDILPQGRMLVRVAGSLDKATSVRLLVDASRSALVVDSEVGSWAVRLVEGRFPDVNRIIPRYTTVALTCQRDALMRALRLLRSVEQTSDGYMVRCQMASGVLTVRAGSGDGDLSAEATLDAVLERGSAMSVAYNAGYFRDAVNAVEADALTLELSSAVTPTLVRAAGAVNGHVQVVMPMRDERGG